MAARLIRIQNYRSIHDLELQLGPLNALIGPNNAGKSNILKALRLVLGEVWPKNPFSSRDFHENDTSRTIEITVLFDAPLQCDPDVHGFSLRQAPPQPAEYFPVDGNGQPCVWPGPRGSPKRISNEMREEVALLYLGLNREADEQLRVTQWTLYGKLLKHLESALNADLRRRFTDQVSAALEAHIRATLTQVQTIIDDFVRSQTGLSVRLDFRASDPVDALKGVRPYVIDNGMALDPEDVGAGVQSALSIAIAKAYAEIVRQPLVLAIEEPELYLHPHGCRHFYRLLRELSENGLQVIYTTHERSFVSAGDFEAIQIVRKPQAATQVSSGLSLNLTASRDRLRLQSRFNERLNEVFFAACVILVEGDPDEIACRCALEFQGLELDKDSVSVVPLGGKDEIPVVAELLARLGIPTIALMDEDPGNTQTAATRARVEELLGPDKVLVQSPNLEWLFQLNHKPKRVEAMEVFPAWFADAEPYTDGVHRSRRSHRTVAQSVKRARFTGSVKTISQVCSAPR